MILVALTLGLLGFMSYLTRYPEAPILAQMESWPAVGPLATRFRETYTPPPPTPDPATDLLERHSTRSMIPLDAVEVPAPQYVWTLAGQMIHSAPDRESEVVQITKSLTRWVRMEKKGDWIRVWNGARKRTAWVFLPGYDDRDPPLGNDPDPPGPLWPRAANPERLAEARGLFEGRERELTLGPYTLITDVRLDGLLQDLGRLAPQLDAAYALRYGRKPLGEPRETVLLFAEPGDYRAAQDLSPSLHGLRSAGHTGPGMVFFFTGGRLRGEILSTFVHEIGHLINRRALGPALPPWLDEGLADDFSAGRLDGKGIYRPDLLAGTRLEWGNTVTYNGPTAGLLNLQRSLRQLPSVEALVSYDRQEFLGSQARRHYDMAAFFVRFLLSTQRADAFRDYLDAVADGEPVAPETLRSRLDESWPELDRAFHAWIRSEAETLSGTASPGATPGAL